MKMLIDTSALLDVYAGSQRGEQVKQLLAESTATFTTSLNAYEAKVWLLRRFEAGKVARALEDMLATVRVLPVPLASALEAADVRRKNQALSAVDCNSYAVAQAHGLLFVTADRDFATLPNVKILT